jgi:hypothetical protein
LNKKVLALADL